MEEKIAFYFKETGEYAPREGFPFSKRENVAIITKYRNKYLLLSWNKVNYDYSLVTGGIENEEEKETAVRRELKEETGYFDIAKIEKVDCINVSVFFVEHKGMNREAIYYPYFVELNSLRQAEIEDYEKNEHTLVWVAERELDNYPLFENHKKMLTYCLKKNIKK